MSAIADIPRHGLDGDPDAVISQLYSLNATGWAALLIGGASAPQAAVSGFGGPYTIPDTATAALGILLAIIILATAGRMGRRDAAPESPHPRR